VASLFKKAILSLSLGYSQYYLLKRRLLPIEIISTVKYLCVQSSKGIERDLRSLGIFHLWLYPSEVKSFLEDE
jgi:hypothetical protein